MANILVKNFGYVDRRRTERDVGRHRRCYEVDRLVNEEMMRLQDFLKQYTWVAWALLAASWIAWGAAQLVRPGPPVVHAGVTVETPTVAAGEKAQFIYHILRNRTCPAQIHGFWLNPKGEAIVRMAPVPGGYGKVGDVYTPVAITTPANYIGPACYRSSSYHSCEDGNYVTTSPDACVTVLAARSN